MEQYIKKSDVIKEIDEFIQALEKSCTPNPFGNTVECMTAAEIEALNLVKESINDIKIKEVDLEEEARKWQDKVYLECGYQDAYGTPHAPFHQIGDAFIAGAKLIINVQKGK